MGIHRDCFTKNKLDDKDSHLLDHQKIKNQKSKRDDKDSKYWYDRSFVSDRIYMPVFRKTKKKGPYQSYICHSQ